MANSIRSTASISESQTPGHCCCWDHLYTLLLLVFFCDTFFNKHWTNTNTMKERRNTQPLVVRCKLVLVGDVQCGKTAMLQVLAKDCYPEVGCSNVPYVSKNELNMYVDTSVVCFCRVSFFRDDQMWQGKSGAHLAVSFHAHFHQISSSGFIF